MFYLIRQFSWLILLPHKEKYLISCLYSKPIKLRMRQKLISMVFLFFVPTIIDEATKGKKKKTLWFVESKICHNR